MRLADTFLALPQALQWPRTSTKLLWGQKYAEDIAAQTKQPLGPPVTATLFNVKIRHYPGLSATHVSLCLSQSRSPSFSTEIPACGARQARWHGRQTALILEVFWGARCGRVCQSRTIVIRGMQAIVFR